MRGVAALGLSPPNRRADRPESHPRQPEPRNRDQTTTGRHHFPPGFLPPPTVVALAALRVIAEDGSEVEDSGGREDARGASWTRDDVDSTLVELVTDGVLLSVDGGSFTLHEYGYPSQAPPTLV